MEFANKEFFWLFPGLGFLIFWHFFSLNWYSGSLRYSSIKSLAKSSYGVFNHVLFFVRILSLSALILALARPQTSLSWQNVSEEGIDIVLALDISGSMLAEDLKPNRLEASKNVAIDFILNRPTDRIGLVVYSGESFTQCPITTDHAVLVNLFKDIKNGMIEDGTAIGMGLSTAVNRLKDSDAKSKVIILLTDGFNTTGAIPPLTAAEIAKAFNVRVYTIGVGTNGQAPYPAKDIFGRTQYQYLPVKIDEKTMKEIASITGGNYFRATNNRKLKLIYEEIDKLEKSKTQITEYRKKNEVFWPLALIAAFGLLLEFILRYTAFRTIT
ncbi:MAG: VWA domain-containing protein [Flavobacteriales bacterium]|nr:VWA domain-containing protein [Flavobacteriales bacterium]